MKKNIFFLLIALGTLSCTKIELETFDFPRIHTLQVTEVDETGATFNLEIINPGNHPIDSIGFVWMEMLPRLFHSEYILIGETDPGVKEYSVRIHSTLQFNYDYEVRSFVRTGEYLVYGNLVEFQSKGCEGPKITSISASSGCPGDTLTAYGSGVSYFHFNNVFKFGDIKAEVIARCHNSVSLIIPQNASPGAQEISFTVLGSTPIKIDFEVIPR